MPSASPLVHTHKKMQTTLSVNTSEVDTCRYFMYELAWPIICDVWLEIRIFEQWSSSDFGVHILTWLGTKDTLTTEAKMRLRNNLLSAHFKEENATYHPWLSQRKENPAAQKTMDKNTLFVAFSNFYQGKRQILKKIYQSQNFLEKTIFGSYCK